MDGNFKLRNLAKNNNAMDTSLWRGHGFLCSKAEIDSHVDRFGGITIEVRLFYRVYFRLDFHDREGRARIVKMRQKRVQENVERIQSRVS